MKRLVRSFSLLLRSERILAENQLKIAAGQLQCNALAGLTGVFGLGMLDVAAFFAVMPHWGPALAALAVGGVNLGLAVGLIVFGRSMKPGKETEMVREMRNLALEEIEEEVALAEQEINEFREQARETVKHPVEALLPHLAGPVLGMVTKGLTKKK